jgi:hypothetical protein
MRASWPCRRWTRPDKWASLYRSWEPIIELRIPFARVQYRPLGVYSKNQRWTFVLLAGAIEKGGKIPRSDLQAADNRRKLLEAEPHRVRRHQFYTP